MKIKFIQWLIDKDIFYEVMTAMRGPDSEDFELKKWFTGPLRWAVGFDYGTQFLFQPETIDIICEKRGYGVLSADEKVTVERAAPHFIEHALSAFRALRRVGYEFSRIPLWVYFASDAEQEAYGHRLRCDISFAMAPEDWTNFINLLDQMSLDIAAAPFHRIDL